MIVLDASVLIAHLSKFDAHHDRAYSLLIDVAGRDLVMSPITKAEVLVGPARVGRAAEAEDALDLLEVRTVGLPDDAPMRLALLRAETGLRLPDCCVLLACDQAGPTGEVATFDDALAAAAAGRARNVYRR